MATTAARPSSSAHRLVVWGMAGLVLLVSMVIAQRGFLMLAQADHTPVTTAAQASPNHHADTSTPQPHSHADHCPLCFMYWMTGDFVGDLAAMYSPLLISKLWLEAALARDEFLKAIAARGPPQG